MRKNITLAATIVAVAPLLAASQARAQTITSTIPSERAEQLEALAAQLHTQPRRAADAAHYYIQSAQLRGALDPAAVQSLTTAAHLLNYAGRPLEARRTMEQAAQRALGLGDVSRAAQAYVEAAFLAERQGNRQYVQRLGTKALLLAESPLLTAEQRQSIRDRIRTSPTLAALQN